jgi:hypothetical protein
MKTPIMQCALVVALVVGPAFRRPVALPVQAPASNDPLSRRVKVAGETASEAKRQTTTAFFLYRLLAAGSPPGGFAIVQGCEEAEPEVQPLLSNYDHFLRRQDDSGWQPTGRFRNRQGLRGR